MGKWKAGKPGRPPTKRGRGRPQGSRNKRRRGPGRPPKLATAEQVKQVKRMSRARRDNSEPPELMSAIAALQHYHETHARPLESIHEVYDRIKQLEENVREFRDSLETLIDEYRNKEVAKPQSDGKTPRVAEPAHPPSG